MPSKIFIDTLFVVVALINQRDAYHERASQLAERYENEPLLTTDAILLEIGNALARNFKSAAIEIIDDFLRRPRLRSYDSIRRYSTTPIHSIVNIKTRNGV